MDPVPLCLVIISPPKVFKWPCRKAQNVTNCHVQNFIFKWKKLKFNEFSLNRIVAFCRKVRRQWNTLVNTREKTSALFSVIRGMAIKYVYNVGISAMMSMINSYISLPLIGSRQMLKISSEWKCRYILSKVNILGFYCCF